MPKRKAPQPHKVAEPAVSYDISTAHRVSVRAAKDQLSALLERAERGEEIVITSDGVPKAMLVRYRSALHAKPFAADMEWLRSIPVIADTTPAIRAERDAR